MDNAAKPTFANKPLHESSSIATGEACAVFSNPGLTVVEKLAMDIFVHVLNPASFAETSASERTRNAARFAWEAAWAFCDVAERKYDR